MLELDEAQVIARVWAEFGRGVRDRRSAWHCPTLVTCDADGTPWPTTVVLRAADAAAGTLLCHTRADAGKVVRLAANPRAAWHVYDRAAKVQVRLWGTAQVHREGPVAEARWAATAEGPRAAYRTPGRPGDALDRAAPEVDGRGRFALIVCRVEVVDWLYLHHAGHRRLRFDRAGGGWEATAVNP